MRIFIVMGETGSYEDHQTWVVKAFLDEDQANSFGIACDNEATKSMDEWREKAACAHNVYRYRPTLGLGLDQGIATEWDTGTSYFVVETELVD